MATQQQEEQHQQQESQESQESKYPPMPEKRPGWTLLLESTVAELKQQFRTAFPALLGMVLYKVPWLISLHFVGHIGSEELAAAALASTLCNVTGLSLSVGLSSALTTLTGQARGDLVARAKDAVSEASKNTNNLDHDRKNSNNKSRRSSSSNNNNNIPPDVIDEEMVEEGSLTVAILTYTDSDITAMTSTSTMDFREEPIAIPLPQQQPQPPLPDDASERTLLIQNKQPQILLPLVYLYRGLFLQLAFVLPVGLWWLIPRSYGSASVEHVLLTLGQGPHLSQMTAAYLRVLTPGLWFYSINWTLTAWLQAIEMAHVPAYATAIGVMLHLPMNFLFIHVLDWGYLGVGQATVLFQALQPFCISLYVFGTHQGRQQLLIKMGAEAVGRTSLLFCWKNEVMLALSSCRGLLQYLGLALPGIVIISEWWASEVVIFLSGRLLLPDPDVAIAAMTIYQSINSFCFMFPVSVSISGSTRVGNLLGAGNPKEAGFASCISIGLAMLLSAILGCILWFTPHTALPHFFTPDQRVVVETSHVIPLLALYIFADGLQSAFNGIIKGCGRQVITMPIVVFAYWVVGIPLSYYLAFIRAGGVLGLVIGTTVGTWLHMILLGLLVVWPLSWDEEAQRAKARVHANAQHASEYGVANMS